MKTAEIIGFPLKDKTITDETPKLSQILGRDFTSRILSKTAARNLDGTIPQDIFLDEMMLVWGKDGYGNTVTDKLKECWVGILDCFNRSLGGPGLNVSSATMGAGKTTTALICLAIHYVLYPQDGSIMVCRRIEECDEAMEALNDLFDEKVSLALHSRSDEDDRYEDVISSYKIVFTTHVNYLASGQVHKADKISNFRNKPRTLTIIDESIGFISRYNLTKKFISDINTRLSFHKNSFFWMNQYGKHLMKLSAIYDRITEINCASDGEIVINHFKAIQKEHKVHIGALARAVARVGQDDWDEMKIRKHSDLNGEYNFLEFRQSLVKDLLSVEASIRLKIWAREVNDHNSHSKTPLLSSGEVMGRISEIFAQESLNSVVVLDATCSIDYTYKQLKECFGSMVHIQEPVEGVRNYRNVQFHLRSEQSGTGKTTAVARKTPRAEKILRWAKEEFTSDNKVIFVGTKDLMETMRKVSSKHSLDFVCDFIHWNCIDGRNDLAEFNTMVYLSIPNPPNNFHEQTALACENDNYLTNQTKRKRFISDANASYIAKSIAQSNSRDLKRRVTSAMGDCGKCDVYLMLNGSYSGSDSYDDVLNSLEPTHKDVVEILQSVFPCAQWKTWDSFTGYNDSDRGKKVSNLVTKFKDYIISELVAGESITRKEVENILMLTPEERETTGQSFKAFNLKKSKVGRDLISAGISFKGKKGPGGNVTFTKES